MTMEAEKRDSGNEVVPHVKVMYCSQQANESEKVIHFQWTDFHFSLPEIAHYAGLMAERCFFQEN